jgi:hypothetical protein
MVYVRSSIPTTRSEFNARLLFLTARNEELEERLLFAEESCQDYQIKLQSQHDLSSNLMDAIHAMTKSESDNNDSSDGSNTHIPEELCLLLTKNAQRVAELSQEVEHMKLLLLNKMQDGNGPNNDFYYENGDGEFDDIDLCDTEKDNLSVSTTSTSSFSISDRSRENIDLKDEVERVTNKCESLERSMKALKRNNTQREVRAMKSLKNMKRQVVNLEAERRRRVEMQFSAEERADKLQIELDQMKQETNERTQSERLAETASEETNSSTSKGVDHCRNLVILRNKQDQDFLPSPLVALKENSELSEVNEDVYVPRMNANELRNSWLTQSSMELPAV